jgi:hypothetical protein
LNDRGPHLFRELKFANGGSTTGKNPLPFSSGCTNSQAPDLSVVKTDRTKGFMVRIGRHANPARDMKALCEKTG